jgi:nucleoside-triphosphatase THEP1
MIYILTGDIRTGKTSALMNWIEGRKDVDGLLSPDNEKGKRYFLKIKSKQTFKFETEVENENTITIGPFHFSKTSFNEANDYLISKISKNENQYVIIDELGKLELKNKGLHLAAKTLIFKFILDEKKHLIIVVRDYLLNDILKHYNILDYRLVTKKDFTKNGLT